MEFSSYLLLVWENIVIWLLKSGEGYIHLTIPYVSIYIYSYMFHPFVSPTWNLPFWEVDARNFLLFNELILYVSDSLSLPVHWESIFRLLNWISYHACVHSFGILWTSFVIFHILLFSMKRKHTSIKALQILDFKNF